MMSTKQKTDVNVIAVENNSYSCIALDDEGRVWTWGDNNNEEQLGRVSASSANRINPHNRGGQVTETIYPGEKLPYIIQISGSERNSLVLDRDGVVWSWGRTDRGALGREGVGTRPGKVEFPAGVEIKWIASAYYGGKAIDKNGNIWVWGEGEQYNLGNGSESDINRPAMLTLDNNNNPLPTNFSQISSSDFHNHCAAIAVTDDGKVFTWGNDDDDERGGAKRPRQTGFNKDIKKIDVGNGTYGFLTHSGELWTWGDNTLVAGSGRQGHDDRLNRAAPKRVENVINSGTKIAPKFKDFSIYAWSACAVDHEGNLFGTGQDNNNKHNTSGTPNIFTKYSLPNDVPKDAKITIVAEGYYSTSHIDIYGNAYVTGNTDTFGRNNNDGSEVGRWVHFNGSGKPMFTELTSAPTSEAKRYNTTPKTTLNAKTNIPCDEVKYVILYPEETLAYTDGEKFYSKSFAEIEPPYYFKNTNPQLLLSPNYDQWTSRYYANPKISEEVFEAAYNLKSTPEKGMMDVVPGTENKVFIKPELVSHNCIVWVQSKNSKGTTRAIYRFDNYYTQTKAWHEGVKHNDSAYILYPPELVGGGYGLFLDRQGKLIPGVPPFGYDNVMPVPKELTYWMLSPTGQVDEEVAEDGYTHRVDRTKEIFLTDLSQRGDEAAKTPRVTFSYEKNPEMWVGADLFFVTESGASVNVLIKEAVVTQESRDAFAPKGVEYVDGQDPYLPPEAEDPATKVVGYRLGTPPSGSGSYTECDFPNGFRPVLEERKSIYIVYSVGMVSVTETFIDISHEGETEMKNNDGLLSVVKNFRQGEEDYDSFGPAINDYVIVGHEIFVEGSLVGREDYPWKIDHYQPKNAVIPSISKQSTVRFLYKSDYNGNNIPDDEEGSVRATWIAVSANNAAYQIAQKTYCGNGKHGANITIIRDDTNVLTAALYNPNQWIFHPGLPSDTAPYLPIGSDGAETIIFQIGPSQDIYFYYDEDHNENGVVDKQEGRFAEQYRLHPSRDDLIPPKADTTSKWLGGQMYVKEAPPIPNYVSVGYAIESDGVQLAGKERVDRDKTGYMTVTYDIPLDSAKENYTVTLLYKEDKNSNNIPDEEEGSVTVRWIGTTYAGNEVEMEKLVIVGYIDDDVTHLIQPSNPIDSIWKLVSSDVLEPVTLSDTPQSYEYRYAEAPEFSTITVESKSTDGNLDFYYQYTKRLTDGVFDATAFAIPTYRVTGYVLYDNYGNEIASGTGDAVTIDPSSGSQRVVFRYVTTVTTVVIRAVDADDYTNILQSQTITDAVIGQMYSATAPYVDETWVLSGELLRVIDVVEGTNYINFEYEKATGNVTILLKENDTNGRIIQVQSETVEHGTTLPIIIPGLTEAYYTQISEIAQVVDYTGSTPVPQTVEYYYAKDLMDVVVKAIDASDNSELKTVSYPNAARKGESYMAIAPSVEWYTISESNSKSVYADPEAAEDTIVVEFFYKKDHHGLITVKYYYLDKDDNEVVLQGYTAKCLVGSKFIAISDTFPGFQLVNADADSIQIIVNADDNKNAIAFEYERTSTTVTIYMIDEDTSDLLAIFSNTETIGGDFTFTAPDIKGYDFTDDSTIGSVSPVLPNDANEITFTYRKSQTM